MPQADGPILLVVADHQHARLLSCTRLRTGRVHVDLISTLGERWNQDQHKMQPSRGGAPGHNYENLGHTEEERIHRFAKEISAWLAHELAHRPLERLVLFAEPRVMGALRREAPAALQHNWVEHTIDLGKLSEGELAQRPELAAMLPVGKE